MQHTRPGGLDAGDGFNRVWIVYENHQMKLPVMTGCRQDTIHFQSLVAQTPVFRVRGIRIAMQGNACLYISHWSSPFTGALTVPV
jgi:hypothetical protein